MEKKDLQKPQRMQVFVHNEKKNFEPTIHRNLG
jgi:hypothetical protein